MKPDDGLAREIPDVDLFAGWSEAERAALAGRLTLRTLRRGDVLVRQGDPADALYLLQSGRLAVTRDGQSEPVSEIGAGQPVGEIAFFTGSRRTATVTAMRDSLVRVLSRDEFEALAEAYPGIWSTLTAVLARRLAATTSRARVTYAPPRPRTICVIPAGGSRISPEFVVALARALRQSARSVVLHGVAARNLLGAGEALDGPAAISRLNALEASHEQVLLIGDDTLSPWSEKAIRHADLVIAVAHHDADPEPSASERFAARLLAPEATRLVLLHPTRGRVKGTSAWLAPRAVAMHHHVALDGVDDVHRLVRFIAGRALGFVAAGGGALAAAHTGVYKAAAEAGLAFDIMGGTSAGAALAAAFILNPAPDDIDRALGEMFVTNRAMSRYTLPRYGLLDHTVFDAELKRLFGAIEIEDLWLPFFAVSTNLTRFALAVHRRGPVWRAIRASASIPVLLPPVNTPEGDMLVDGCLLDNTPVKVMRTLKEGPNIVVSFRPPELDRFDADHDALPSRGALLRHLLNPVRRVPLPEAPGLVTVLMRALMANRRDFQRELEDDDVLLMPPIPETMSFLDWHRHSEVFAAACLWARDEIAARAAAGRPSWLGAALRARAAGQ